MPLFDYRCEPCKVVIEHYTPSYTKESIICHLCNQEAKRVDKVYPPALNFQGSGFYSTDYK